jgi:hypothetical protein
MKSVENWKGMRQISTLFSGMSSSMTCYRMVAEAAAGKSKHHQMQADARAAAKARLREQAAHGEKVPSDSAATP